MGRKPSRQHTNAEVSQLFSDQHGWHWLQISRQEVNVTLSRKCSLADSLLQQMFIVRFLGSMAVKTDNTTEVIYEAMRQVLAARAIHNIFRMTESHLMVTSQTLRYTVACSDFLTASSHPLPRHIYTSRMFILA